MRILISGARAPVALELVRALGRAGHTVYAADSMAGTLAGSSRHAAGAVLLPPPRRAPDAFGAALLAAVEAHRIELVIPTCEEVFYVAMAHAALAARCRVFCEPLDKLARWHHKGDFERRAAGLGLLTPRTALLRSGADLRAALPSFPRYLLKPAYSRFATRIITNCGPHAGARPLGTCRPTPAQPWLLQEYIDGAGLCSYSTLHAGHVTAHCAYTTPVVVGQGSGAAFCAVEGAATLEVARALGGAGYSGQLSLDFIRAPSGRLYLLECNPRATSGAHLIRADRLVGGLLDPAQPTWVEPAGRRRQLSAAVLPLLASRALRRPLDGRGWRDLAAAAGTRDAIMRAADPLPALAQLAQSLRFWAISRRERIGLLAATTADIEWNGDAALHQPEP
jgi:predicted ATP-grasp superfamily ATP-dependent carboligase